MTYLHQGLIFFILVHKCIVFVPWLVVGYCFLLYNILDSCFGRLLI